MSVLFVTPPTPGRRGSKTTLRRTMEKKIVDEKQVKELDEVLDNFRAKDIPYLKKSQT